MQKITPSLCFNGQAEEGVKFTEICMIMPIINTCVWYSRNSVVIMMAASPYLYFNIFCFKKHKNDCTRLSLLTYKP